MDGDALAIAAALEVTHCDVRLGDLQVQLPFGAWTAQDDSVWFEADSKRLLRYVMHKGACVWVELA